LRSAASLLLNESGKWHTDAIERQLAHQEANEIRGTYTHAAEFWQERVRMMRWWADELDRLRELGHVVRIRAERRFRTDAELLFCRLLSIGL
jgi:hypothetical protein